MTDEEIVYVYRRAFLTGIALGAILGFGLTAAVLSLAGVIR